MSDGAAPRARSIGRQIAHSFASLLTGTAAQIVLGVVLARTLGPVGKGIYSLAQVYTAIGTSAGDGIRSAYAFETGRAQKRPPGGVWGATLAQTCVAALAGCGACVGLAFVHPGQVLYPWLAVAVPAVIYLQVINLLWAMSHRLETLNVRTTLTLGAGSSVVSIVALLVFHASLAVVLGIYTAGICVAAVWLSFGLRAFVGEPASWPGWPIFREQSVFAAKATFSALATLLTRRIDVVIVATFASPRDLGIYTLAIATAEVMFQVSNSITWATVGRVATLGLEEANVLVARVLRTLMLLQGAAGLVLFVAGPWLITVVYGRRFEDAGLPLRLVIPGVVCYSADQLLSFYISARSGRPGLLLAFEVSSLAICGGAAAFGLAHFGIAGAAAANTITYVLSFGVKAGYFVRAGRLGMREVFVPRWSDVPDRFKTLLARR